MNNGNNDNSDNNDTLVKRHEIVKDTVKFFLDLANEIYKTNFNMPQVRFDLRGCTAGQARYTHNSVRFNNVFLIEEWKDMIENTVPHEVAHIIARRLHPHRRIKPHGCEWKAVMKVFGVNATVTHTYDVTNARVRKIQRYEYTCSCGKTFNITSIKHNKIRRGQKRMCRACRGILEWTGQLAKTA